MTIRESKEHCDEINNYLARGYINYGFIAFIKLSFFATMQGRVTNLKRFGVIYSHLIQSTAINTS